MAEKDLTNVGLNVSTNDRDKLDEFKREWDQLESRNISRSDVAREVLPLGLVAWEAFMNEFDTEAYRIPTRERNAMVRQALYDFFREQDEE